jgi:hypothetical protein
MAAPEILLLYFAMPLWFVAGFAEWLRHRHAHLPETAGPFESVLQLPMFAEAGLALLIGLFCEFARLSNADRDLLDPRGDRAVGCPIRHRTPESHLLGATRS